MDAKEATQVAKEHIALLYSGEGITNVGLEELEFDDRADEWRVTVGFSRPWDHKNLAGALASARPGRSYKVVRIDDLTGEVVSLKDRLLAPSS